MQTELVFLRTEMELNRRYIFERPLLIVAGGITAAATLAPLAGYGILPLLFTILLGYNLWFTYNRLCSNSRIISYLQVIHTPEGAPYWIGWETALHRFRTRDRGKTVSPPCARAQRENRFYGPILVFHVVAAMALDGFLFAQAYPGDIWRGHFAPVQLFTIVINGIAVIGFLVLIWLVQPANVRDTVEEAHVCWRDLLIPALPQMSDERPEPAVISEPA